MHVGVYSARADSPQYFGELSWRDALRRGASDDVGGSDVPTDGARMRPGAQLCSGRTVTQVRAKEDHDASIDTLLGNVNVRLRHISHEIRITHLVVERRICGIDLHSKRA